MTPESPRYIIRLNPVDCLTLSGVLTSALGLGSAGQRRAFG